VWDIYSAAPTGDTFGALNSNNMAVWNTAAGGTVTASGNRYVFAYQPTLTVTTTSDSKTYGQTTTANGIATDYTISGLQAGVTGAYLGDTASAVYSGAPTVTSAGTAATASAGGAYGITATNLTVTDGYAVAYANTGLLTVNAAPTPTPTPTPTGTSGSTTTTTTTTTTPTPIPVTITPTPTPAPVTISFNPTNIVFTPANGANDNSANGLTSVFSPLGSGPLGDQGPSSGGPSTGSTGGAGQGPGSLTGDGDNAGSPYPDNRWVSSSIRFKIGSN